MGRRGLPSPEAETRHVGVLAVLLFTVIPVLSAEDPKKPKRPGLDLRATPRMAFSPAEVLFTAELKGGATTSRSTTAPR